MATTTEVGADTTSAAMVLPSLARMGTAERNQFVVTRLAGELVATTVWATRSTSEPADWRPVSASAPAGPAMARDTDGSSFRRRSR